MCSLQHIVSLYFSICLLYQRKAGKLEKQFTHAKLHLQDEQNSAKAAFTSCRGHKGRDGLAIITLFPGVDLRLVAAPSVGAVKVGLAPP